MLAFSQKFKPLDSLTVVNFGSSKKTVVETIKGARGVWEVAYSRPQYYVFSNLKFDDKSKALFVVKFTRGKAYETDYIITPNRGVSVLRYYYELIEKINGAYGTPKSGNNFKSPCRDGDENAINAIKLGLVYYSAYWPAGDNSIIISIDGRLRIVLAVQDDKLTNGAFENQSAVN